MRSAPDVLGDLLSALDLPLPDLATKEFVPSPNFELKVDTHARYYEPKSKGKLEYLLLHSNPANQNPSVYKPF